MSIVLTQCPVACPPCGSSTCAPAANSYVTGTYTGATPPATMPVDATAVPVAALGTWRCTYVYVQSCAFFSQAWGIPDDANVRVFFGGSAVGITPNTANVTGSGYMVYGGATPLPPTIYTVPVLRFCTSVSCAAPVLQVTVSYQWEELTPGTWSAIKRVKLEFIC